MVDLAWSRDGGTWPNHDASQFIEAAGLRWHVQIKADGPALLLVHGTGAATHSWRGLLPMLAQHFTVVAPDLPGHGFTQSPAGHRLSLPGMASDLAQLLKVLGVTPDVVVGHSAGAAILARMCLDRRITPKLLVSLNGAFLPFGGFAGHLFSPLAKLLALNPLVPRLFAWQAGSDGAIERLLRDTGSAIDADGIASYRKLVRSPAHVAAALRMMANWQLEPLSRDLPSLTTPLLLIAAERDRAVPTDVARKVHALVRGSELVRLPGLGHLAHEEQAQLVSDLIVKHFALQQST